MVESFSFPSYLFDKKEPSSPKTSPQEPLICGTDSCMDVSHNTTILTRSSLG